jgi:hypothetical protein
MTTISRPPSSQINTTAPARGVDATPQKSSIEDLKELRKLEVGVSGPDTREDIAELQKLLVDVGELKEGQYKPGVFDDTMKQAVLHYQQDVKDRLNPDMVVDGKVGQQTWGSFLGLKVPPGVNLLKDGGKPESPERPSGWAPRPSTPTPKPATPAPNGAATATPAAETPKPAAPPPAAPAAPPTPTIDVKRASSDATNAYNAMKGGLLGIGTDEKKLFAALEHQSPAQLDSMRAAYKDHYHRDLDSDVRGELSGKDLERANDLLKGNPAAADAVHIKQSLGTLWNNNDAVYDTLAGKSPKELQEIKASYQAQYGESLETALQKHMSGDKLARAQGLLRGDEVSADAAKMHKALHQTFGGSEDVMTVLKDKTPEQIGALRDEFKKQGRNLDLEVENNLHGTHLKEAKALLAGTVADKTEGTAKAEGPAKRTPVDPNSAAARNRAMADAAVLEGAAGFFHTDGNAIEKTLTGKSPEEIGMIKDAYKKSTGRDLETDFKKEMSGHKLEHALELLNGYGDHPAAQLHKAMAGLGTDEDLIKDTLRGKSKSEIANISAEYQQRYGKDLASELKSELSGRDLFDVQQMMRGTPDSPSEALQRINEKRDYERSGAGNWISKHAIDLVSSSGKILDGDVDRANAFYNDAVLANKAAGLGDKLTPVQEAELGKLIGYSDSDVKGYREARDTAGEVTAQVTTAVAAGVTIAVTGGAAAPVIAAAAVARVASKAAFEGGTYSAADLASDAAVGGVEGALNLATFGAATVAKGATAAGEATAQAVAKGAGRLVSEEAAARIGTVAGRVAGGAVQGMAQGAVGGGLGSGANAVLNDKTWTDGVMEGLERVAVATGAGTATGAVVGAGIGGALNLGGHEVHIKGVQAAEKAPPTGAMAEAEALRGAKGALKPENEAELGKLKKVYDDIQSGKITPKTDTEKKLAGQLDKLFGGDQANGAAAATERVPSVREALGGKVDGTMTKPPTEFELREAFAGKSTKISKAVGDQVLNGDHLALSPDDAFRKAIVGRDPKVNVTTLELPGGVQKPVYEMNCRMAVLTDNGLRELKPDLATEVGSHRLDWHAIKQLPDPAAAPSVRQALGGQVDGGTTRNVSQFEVQEAFAGKPTQINQSVADRLMNSQHKALGGDDPFAKAILSRDAKVQVATLDLAGKAQQPVYAMGDRMAILTPKGLQELPPGLAKEIGSHRLDWHAFKVPPGAVTAAATQGAETAAATATTEAASSGAVLDTLKGMRSRLGQLNPVSSENVQKLRDAFESLRNMGRKALPESNAFRDLSDWFSKNGTTQDLMRYAGNMKNKAGEFFAGSRQEGNLLRRAWDKLKISKNPDEASMGQQLGAFFKKRSDDLKAFGNKMRDTAGKLKPMTQMTEAEREQTVQVADNFIKFGAANAGEEVLAKDVVRALARHGHKPELVHVALGIIGPQGQPEPKDMDEEALLGKTEQMLKAETNRTPEEQQLYDQLREYFGQ